MSTNHLFSCKQKPEIDYPCSWLYKVIGEREKEIKEAVHQICAGKAFTFAYSHTSTGGKYHSFNVELEVENEEERVSIYNSFINHPAVKVVI